MSIKRKPIHPVSSDLWADRSQGRVCDTCIHYVAKAENIGRCRRHAPTHDGYPVVFPADFCGDHKLDEDKI